MTLDEFRYKTMTCVVSILLLCTQDWNFAINNISKRLCVFAFMGEEFERLLDGCVQLVLWVNIIITVHYYNVGLVIKVFRSVASTEKLLSPPKQKYWPAYIEILHLF